jgi:hypothetical protein
MAYVVVACIGLVVALLRGNDPVLAIGQVGPALLFAAGFLAAPALVSAPNRERSVLGFALITLVLAIPDARGTFEWLLPGGSGVYRRFIGGAAILAPVAAILLVGVLGRRRPYVVIGLSGVLGALLVLSFTRSYWLGAGAGAAVLAVAFVLARRRGAGERVRSRRAIALGAALGAVLVASAVLTPVASEVRTRLSQGTELSSDYSRPVREYELGAAVNAIHQRPVLGLGAGGRYTSLYQENSTVVSYGSTNFIHNVWLYFPLKFGLAGLWLGLLLVVGSGVLVAAALRSARQTGDPADAAFAAAFVVILVASATAPDLVDPVYAALTGLLARAALRQSRGVSADGRNLMTTPFARPVIATFLLACAGSAALALTNFSVNADVSRLVSAQARHPTPFVSGIELDAAGRLSPSGRLLAWWRAVQFGASKAALSGFYCPTNGVRGEQARREQFARGLAPHQKPFVIAEQVERGRSRVLAIVAPEGLKPGRREVNVTALVRLGWANDQWCLQRDGSSSLL